MSLGKEKYMKLTKNEAQNIVGGAGITGTLINSLIRSFNTSLDVGRYFGSSIRRLFGGASCPIR